MAKFIVSEFQTNKEECTNQDPLDVWRTFIGVFSEEELPNFIETKITEYIGDVGDDEYIFMKILVREVLEKGNMCNGDEDCRFLLIDEVNPKTFAEKDSLLECTYYDLKKHLAALRKAAKDEEARRLAAEYDTVPPGDVSSECEPEEEEEVSD